MSNSEHQRELPTAKASIPMTPDQFAPEIKYDEESDTLWIGNGRPSPNGMDLFDGCVVFFDSDRQVSGIMLEDAREVLLPFLKGDAVNGLEREKVIDRGIKD